MKEAILSNDQLELAFERAAARRARAKREVRVSKSRWWFRQMRLVVDQAMDWRPMPPGRPEQIYLVLPKQRA